MRYGCTLRERLAGGGVVGGHVFLGDPAISEALALYSYDFIWIDAEHAAFDRSMIQNHVIAANAGGAAAIVRVPAWSMESIKPVLELGVDGIIIPQTKGYEDAKAAIAECLYPPSGVRGFGPRRAIEYNNRSFSEYAAQANDEFVRIIQIEHYQAVEEIEKTLTIVGLDALVFGPHDLAASMGYIGEDTHPEVLKLCAKTIASAKRKGIPIGTSIGPNPQSITRWKEMGIDYFACGDDISFLHNGAKSALAQLR